MLKNSKQNIIQLYKLDQERTNLYSKIKQKPENITSSGVFMNGKHLPTNQIQISSRQQINWQKDPKGLNSEIKTKNFDERARNQQNLINYFSSFSADQAENQVQANQNQQNQQIEKKPQIMSINKGRDGSIGRICGDTDEHNIGQILVKPCEKKMLNDQLIRKRSQQKHLFHNGSENVDSDKNIYKKDRIRQENRYMGNIYEQTAQLTHPVNWPNKMKQKTQDAYYQRFSDTISINEESKSGCIQKKKIFEVKQEGRIRVLDDPAAHLQLDEIYHEDKYASSSSKYKTVQQHHRSAGSLPKSRSPPSVQRIKHREGSGSSQRRNYHQIMDGQRQYKHVSTPNSISSASGIKTEISGTERGEIPVSKKIYNFQQAQENKGGQHILRNANSEQSLRQPQQRAVQNYTILMLKPSRNHEKIDESRMIGFQRQIHIQRINQVQTQTKIMKSLSPDFHRRNMGSPAMVSRTSLAYSNNDISPALRAYRVVDDDTSPYSGRKVAMVRKKGLRDILSQERYSQMSQTRLLQPVNASQNVSQNLIVNTQFTQTLELDLAKVATQEGELSSTITYQSLDEQSRHSVHTEERNFSPGKQQFKKFLNKNKAEPKHRLVPQQTQNIEESGRKQTQHLRTNSYIGSNRMSPTPQPVPIHVFSQTESAPDSSPNREIKNFMSTDEVLDSSSDGSSNGPHNLSGNFQKFQQINDLTTLRKMNMTAMNESQEYIPTKTEEQLEENKVVQNLSRGVKSHHKRLIIKHNQIQQQIQIYNKIKAINKKSSITMGAEQSNIQNAGHVENQEEVAQIEKLSEDVQETQTTDYKLLKVGNLQHSVENVHQTNNLMKFPSARQRSLNQHFINNEPKFVKNPELKQLNVTRSLFSDKQVRELSIENGQSQLRADSNNNSSQKTLKTKQRPTFDQKRISNVAAFNHAKKVVKNWKKSIPSERPQLNHENGEMFDMTQTIEGYSSDSSSFNNQPQEFDEQHAQEIELPETGGIQGGVLQGQSLYSQAISKARQKPDQNQRFGYTYTKTPNLGERQRNIISISLVEDVDKSKALDQPKSLPPDHRQHNVQGRYSTTYTPDIGIASTTDLINAQVPVASEGINAINHSQNHQFINRYAQINNFNQIWKAKRGSNQKVYLGKNRHTLIVPQQKQVKSLERTIDPQNNKKKKKTKRDKTGAIVTSPFLKAGTHNASVNVIQSPKQIDKFSKIELKKDSSFGSKKLNNKRSSIQFVPPQSPRLQDQTKGPNSPNQSLLMPKTTKNPSGFTDAMKEIGGDLTVRKNPLRSTKGTIPNITNFQGAKLSSQIPAKITFATPMQMSLTNSTIKSKKPKKGKKQMGLPKSAREDQKYSDLKTAIVDIKKLGPRKPKYFNFINLDDDSPQKNKKKVTSLSVNQKLQGISGGVQSRQSFMDKIVSRKGTNEHFENLSNGNSSRKGLTFLKKQNYSFENQSLLNSVPTKKSGNLGKVADTSLKIEKSFKFQEDASISLRKSPDPLKETALFNDSGTSSISISNHRRLTINPTLKTGQINNRLRNHALEHDEQEMLILKNLPSNGCNCNRDPLKQKKGCVNALEWLNIAYKGDYYTHFSNYKMYQGFLKMNQYNDQESQIEDDIWQDIERTFQHLEYFQQNETKSSLQRILLAFSNYETTVGYVQGMSFIAAVLLFHGGEVAAFWLLCALMEKKYQLKYVLQQDLPGLQAHQVKLEELGRIKLPQLFEHFDKNYVTVSLFATDWIISVFMNFIPIEISHIYVDLFFKKGWNVFYEVSIQILKYYEKDLLKMNDAGQIIGQIKQARQGCEHLLMLSDYRESLKSIETNQMLQPENLMDDSSIFEDSSDINFKNASPSSKVIRRPSYHQNPLYVKNLQMWHQIIQEVKLNEDCVNDL